MWKARKRAWSKLRMVSISLRKDKRDVIISKLVFINIR